MRQTLIFDQIGLGQPDQEATDSHIQTAPPEVRRPARPAQRRRRGPDPVEVLIKRMDDLSPPWWPPRESRIWWISISRAAAWQGCLRR